MNDKKDIRELSLKEISDFLEANGEKAFRAKQIWQWLWEHGVHSFDEMTNLSKDTRQMLNDKMEIRSISVLNTQNAPDGTVKTAWNLFDGNVIESVLIPGKQRFTICVSSQVGCQLGCKFCATGTLGFKRNLTAGEIFDQVTAAITAAKEQGENLANIVFMGMGEPLLNYDNVLLAISHITDEKGLGMSPSRITLSTSGVADGIKKLADDAVRFNLAVSLHTAKESLRSSLMPINQKYSLTELAQALRYFVDKTGTRPTLEYLMLDGLNDSLDDAKTLAKYCRQFPVKINIIEYNAVEGLPYKSASDKRRDEFVKFLESCNMVVNVRRSKGKNIDAACGQLAGKNKKREQEEDF